MKKTIFIIGLICLSVACLPSNLFNYADPEGDQKGFYFAIVNKTGQEQSNVSITIGGMQNDTFIGTDSYDFQTLLDLSDQPPGRNFQVFANPYRWNPDLSKVKAISDSVFFSVNIYGRDILVGKSGMYDENYNVPSKVLAKAIPENNIIKFDNRSLTLAIEKDTVVGFTYHHVGN